MLLRRVLGRCLVRVSAGTEVLKRVQEARGAIEPKRTHKQVFETPGAPAPKSKKNLEKSLFRGLQEKHPEKSPKKSNLGVF